MQGQLRALWVDQPQVIGDIDGETTGPRHGADEAEDAVPAQRHSAEDKVEAKEERAEKK
jgi:hypothetical protein